MSRRSSRRVELPLLPQEEEDGGVTEQEQTPDQFEEEEAGDEESFEEEGVAYGGEGWEDDEGDDEGIDEGEEVDDEMEDEVDEETGSMSPTDALLGKTVEDPICYHCGVALVDPPLRLPTEPEAGSQPPSVLPSPSAKISIPLHCEVCIRGIHSQCHIALGGALPTQEESFVCFHCRTSQHGKYAMKAADRARVSVGPAHQVPRVPDMFFTGPVTSIARERFVQVWSAQTAVSLVPSDRQLGEYFQRACQAWPDRLRVNSSGGSLAPGSIRRLYLPRAATYASTNTSLNHYWCPYSTEHALTIVHKSDYDLERALSVIKNPALRDCFALVCFPPSKPYYNKWKPKDRRWRMMKIPFPPSRIEAPALDGNSYEDSGPRLRSRRYLNY